VAFDPLAPRGHVVGIGASEHETIALLRVVESQLLGDGTTLRVTEDRRGLDAQVIEQARQI